MSDIINELYKTILNQYGQQTADNFIVKTEIHFGQNFEIGTTTGIEQVQLINKFWRAQLTTYDNSDGSITNIRCWLAKGHSIDDYVYSFENYWLKDIIALGMFQ